MDVKLDPALQDKCLIDLGKWCSEKTETGQVTDIAIPVYLIIVIIIIIITFMMNTLHRVQML